MTVALAVTDRTEKLSLGRVIRRSIGLVRDQAPAYALLGLVTVIPVDLFYGLLRISGAYVDPDDMLASMRGAPGEHLLAALAAVFFLGGAIPAAMARLRGAALGFGPMASDAVFNFRRVFAILFLSNLGVWIGMIALVIPGLLLWARWSVAVPAGLAEDLTFGRAMMRSTQLTEGYRGPIIVLYLLLVAVTLAIVFGLLIVAAALDEIIGGPYYVSYILAVPLGALSALSLEAVLRTAIYEELIRIRQGGQVEDLAQVFA